MNRWIKVSRRGAGGTQGGEFGFLIGLATMIAGFYLLFNAINVRSHFGFGVRLFGIGAMGITTGILVIPFMAGEGIIFYSVKMSSTGCWRQVC